MTLDLSFYTWYYYFNSKRKTVSSVKKTDVYNLKHVSTLYTLSFAFNRHLLCKHVRFS